MSKYITKQNKSSQPSLNVIPKITQTATPSFWILCIATVFSHNSQECFPINQEIKLNTKNS